MVCKACGRATSNENANYCEYCGTSFRDNFSISQNDYTNMESGKSDTITAEESEKPISFGNWIGTLLIPFIPIVGILIYMVMMFVWAFSSDTPKSKKNWARASLIVGIIAIILFIFFFVSAMMDIINSGMDINSYMNQFYY